ncbi:MAG: sigma-54-dependent transcriptional regulator, partial [Myxococcota bacterium]
MPPQSIRILIVEDNDRHAELIEEQLLGMKLADPPCAIRTARSRCGEDALARIRRDEADVVLLDYGLPDYDGLELLQEIRAARSRLPVVFVTSRASVKVAVEAMKSGASDYLVKDETYLEALPVILADVIARCRLREDNRRLKVEVSRQSREIRALRTALSGRYRLREIVASGPAMLRVLRMLELAIESTASVLLEGETGTGKEVLARAIHANGARRDRVLVAQNCAAIPEALLESELFGVARGAFTGADRDRKGLFEAADGGTLFLDEIGELPLHLQAKLLRVIQEQEVRPLGSTRVRKIDVRIIAATNLDLECAVEEGKFRKDLYYRLSVLPIRVPPLRARPEDIPH